MISYNFPLRELNTFGIDVKCSQFARFSSKEELIEILNQRDKSLPFMILGGGSNLLFTKDFEGLILKNEILGVEFKQLDDEFTIVTSGAGEQWHSLVLKTIEKNLGGLENLSLIPGNVGASPMQNIGAYGKEIKDSFYSLEALNISSGEIQTFTNEECKFGYRQSVFKHELKNQYIILQVSFKLSSNPIINTTYGAIEIQLSEQGISNPTIKDVSDAVIRIRQSKLPDPKQIGNAGSFFKNPVVDIEWVSELQKNHPDIPNYPAGEGKAKLAAGWLIEQAGWKGKTINNYGVHQKQALVLVNYGGATGNEIYDLSTAILEDIKDKFGVELEREVNIL